MPNKKVSLADQAVTANTASAIAEREVAVMALANSGATAAFDTLVNQFEEILGLPYLPKTDTARNGTPFTVHRVSERIETDPETGETSDAWVLLVTLEDDAILSMRNSGEVLNLSEGDRALVTFKRTPVKDPMLTSLQELTNTRGPVAHLTLKEVPKGAKAKPQDNHPIVLTTVARWQSLSDAKASRGKQ